jgi:ankyrin repeat protein
VDWVEWLSTLIDVDLKDNIDMSPLSWASRNGHREVVEMLLNKGSVDIDSRDNEDSTPLSGASRYGHAGVVKLLIERGARTDLKDKNGYTPLQWATENSQSHVVKLLLEQRGDTLHTLVQRGERTYLHSLLSKTNVDSRDPLNQTPLHVAVFIGHLEIARDIISSGADINAEDGLGRSPLRLAIEQRRPDFIHLLLQHSADPRGIEAHEWLDSLGYQSSAVIWLKENGVSIITSRGIQQPLPLWGPERTMMQVLCHSCG